MGEDGAEVKGRAAALVGGPAGPESGPSVVSELSGGIVVPITRGSGDGAACSCDKGFAVFVAVVADSSAEDTAAWH